ncbi:MAG: cytochrome C [Methylococcaceae bacterium]|nr:cytochrome C [Methylococcaceae bacterium]
MALFALLSPAAAFATLEANAIDKPVLHPAIPLLDESGAHVLVSGKPYSPKTSCGVGSGCHDYEAISHAGHFERGRDEADDDYGKKRGGWSHVFSPGYYGGFNCMGPGIAAKKTPGADGFVGDFGAAGMIKSCIECHTGGGWSEKDRDGIRYDQKEVATITPLDGDYYNRGTDENNKDASMGVFSRWDWKKSGVVENDCLMCHGDLSHLKIFPASQIGTANTDIWEWMDLQDTPKEPFGAWFDLRQNGLMWNGYFREGASSLLEFLNLKPDAPDGLNLVSFDRTIKDGMGALNFDAAGKPILHWNPAAFDTNGKVQIPMRRFPSNDNCWQCHGYTLEQNRRGFWGFGGAASETRDANGVISGPFDYKNDVHKGRSFTENNGESRVIDSCNACHTQGYYYKPSYSNVDLSANHNFPKGDSDIDIRRDRDYRPGAKSCEYCHDTADHKVIPSKQPSLLDAHRERWTQSGFMAGYPQSALTKIAKTHLDVVGCETCHINGLKGWDGSDIKIFYRYRKAENGRLKIVPYKSISQFRYYWKDKNSGRILTREDLFSAYTVKKDKDGKLIGRVVKDPSTGVEYELPKGLMPFKGNNFKNNEVYGPTHALKGVYDNFLKQKGYVNPDVQLVWIQSNAYLLSHNTRPAVSATACGQCHNRKQDGAYSSLLADNGILGKDNVQILENLTDKRLVDEGVVVLGEPYMKLTDDNKIVVSMADILNVTRLDPSMSSLKADSAKLTGGEWTKLGLDQAFQRLGVSDATERQTLGLELGSQEAFVFSLLTGDAKLSPVAVASAASPMAEAILPRTRLELEVRDPTASDTQTITGLGKLASAVYSLRMRDEHNKALTDFNGQTALVKLPYSGLSNDPKKVDILANSGGNWGSSGLTPLVVHPVSTDSGSDPLSLHPSGTENTGYVVFAAAHPFDAITLTDKIEPPVVANNGGGSGGSSGNPSPVPVNPPSMAELAKAKSVADKAERRALRAEKSAAKAAQRMQMALEQVAKTSGHAKMMAEKAAAKAKASAEAAHAKAMAARSTANQAQSVYASLAKAAGQ